MADNLCIGFKNPKFNLFRMRLAHHYYHNVFEYDCRLKYEFFRWRTSDAFVDQVLADEEFYDMYCTRILENSTRRFFSEDSVVGSQMLFSEKEFVLMLVGNPPTAFLRALVEINIRPIDDHIRWMAETGYELYMRDARENSKFYLPWIHRFSWNDKSFFVFKNMGEGAQITRVVDETGAFVA